jgi:hypothetical protein
MGRGPEVRSASSQRSQQRAASSTERRATVTVGQPASVPRIVALVVAATVLGQPVPIRVLSHPSVECDVVLVVMSTVLREGIATNTTYSSVHEVSLRTPPEREFVLRPLTETIGDLALPLRTERFNVALAGAELQALRTDCYLHHRAHRIDPSSPHYIEGPVERLKTTYCTRFEAPVDLGNGVQPVDQVGREEVLAGESLASAAEGTKVDEGVDRPVETRIGIEPRQGLALTTACFGPPFLRSRVSL